MQIVKLGTDSMCDDFHQVEKNDQHGGGKKSAVSGSRRWEAIILVPGDSTFAGFKVQGS